MKDKRTRCAACGGWEEPGLYHPHAFCVLVEYYQGDTERARMSLNTVIDWGRKLERHGLPNGARIATVFHADNGRRRKRKKSTGV